MIRTFAILALLAVSAFGASFDGQLNSSVAVTSGANVINYGSLIAAGPTLNINTNAAANVTLSVVTTSQASLPDGYAFIGAGFSLQVSPSSAFVSASLETSVVANVYVVLLATAGIQSGLLNFNTQTQSYNQVGFDTQLSAQGTLTFQLPNLGTYVIVSRNISFPAQLVYGTAATIYTGIQNSIQFSENLVINLTTNAEANVTVTASSTTSASESDPDDYDSVGLYFTVTVEGGSNVKGTLSASYNSSAVADVAEDTLKFAVYTTEWVVDTASTVDVSANVVVSSSQSFSSSNKRASSNQYGVFGSQKNDAASSSSSSSAFVLVPSLLITSIAMLLNRM